MENDPKMQQKFQEMQMLEQGLQNILMQKQAFQMEVSEARTALKEVETAKDEVYKVVGQLMIKSTKDKVVEDLKNKEKVLDLRLKNLEKQEDSMNEKLDTLREEVMKAQK